MSLIVSDTSPINLLVQIGLMDVLPKMFQIVIVPPEVATELLHDDTPHVVREFIQNRPDWFQVQIPKTVLSFPDLHPGESAAISLAIELSSMLLIDERDGRAVAKANGLSVIGAVGVIERAANRGLVPDLAAVHDAIRSLPFHVTDRILQESLARHRTSRSDFIES